MDGWTFAGGRRGFEKSYVAPAVWFGDQTNNVIIATIVAGRLFLFYPPTARKREQLPELSACTEGYLFGRPHVGPPSPVFASTQARPDSLSRTLLQLDLCGFGTTAPNNITMKHRPSLRIAPSFRRNLCPVSGVGVFRPFLTPWEPCHAAVFATTGSKQRHEGAD
jgi:hypothetical protein